MTATDKQRLQRVLLAAAVCGGGVLGWLSVRLLMPVVTTVSLTSTPDVKVVIPAYDYGLWRAHPVQEGRIKPFETACADAVRQITGRTRFEGHDPIAIVVAWMLDSDKDGERFTDWENVPFLLCAHRGLREQIYSHRIEQGQPLTPAQRQGKYIAPADLRRSPNFDRLLGETARRRKELQGRAHLQLSTEHLKAEEVGRRLALFDAIRGKLSTRLHVNAIVGGQYLDLQAVAEVEESSPEEVLARLERRLRRYPDPFRLIALYSNPDGVWLSLSELRAVKQNPQKWRDLMDERQSEMKYPEREIDHLSTMLDRVQDAYRSGEPERFDHRSHNFFGSARLHYGRDLIHPEWLSQELWLNRVQPFFWAWVLMLAAMVMLWVSLATQWRAAYLLGLLTYLVSIMVQAYGFWLRVAIAGRAPVSNLYETVIFAAFMAALFALILELIYRRTVIALAGAAVATFGLILADQLPLALDPKISPMVPVLRTNYWLTIHVLTIVASYAAGTLAWGLGNLTLGLLAFGRGKPETLKTLAQFTYRAMQITVMLLAAGTFLGGWWAAEAWGRFWGWDPKEVGALIALVCYVLPLHARYLGWVRDFGLAVSAVLCYAAILLSWYVINFVIAAGLHSYGFSAGGGAWVLWAALINVEWVLLASWIYLRKSGLSEPLAA